MSLTVINPETGEEAAMFGDEMLDMAKTLADQLARDGGQWVVVRTTVREETVYTTAG